MNYILGEQEYRELVNEAKRTRRNQEIIVRAISEGKLATIERIGNMRTAGFEPA